VQSSTEGKSTARPKLTSTLLAEEGKDPSPPGVASAGGQGVALRVLEDTIIGGQASAKTNQLIYKQLNDQPAGTSPVDTLNLLTALVLGSPEFQLR
jgi:hypothetical protein